MESAAEEVISSLMEKNAIEEENIVSLVFSQTSDLDVANPAAALRKTGRFAWVPLFCTQEPEYEGSLPFMLRVLVTFDGDREKKTVPVYLGDAVKLRNDLVDGE